MRNLVLRAAVMALIYLGAAAATKSLTPATPATVVPQAAAISIDEIHRLVDLRSLPELEISDFY
jgi:hypothetical protein